MKVFGFVLQMFCLFMMVYASSVDNVADTLFWGFLLLYNSTPVPPRADA